MLEILTLNEKGSQRVSGFGFCILEILGHAKEEKVHFGHLYYHIISYHKTALELENTAYEKRMQHNR